MRKQDTARFLSAAVLVLVSMAFPRMTSAQTAGDPAAELIASSGIPGGICVVVGRDCADLAVAVAKQGPFTVHVLCPDADSCTRTRNQIRGRGVYGTVSAMVWADSGLPYVPSLVNVLIVTDAPDSTSAARARETARVLAPYGSVFFRLSTTGVPDDSTMGGLLTAGGLTGVRTVKASGSTWLKAEKPWPEQIDEWTHFLHGADSNPVANDTVIGPPQHFQWVSDPLWLRSHETNASTSTMVTARGRLFLIEDQAPISLTGQHDFPSKWSLIARDAFNGLLLWKVPIRRWGWREWKKTWFGLRPGDFPLNLQKRLVAVGDKVYVTLGYQAPVSQLDARTGDILQTYAGTERTNEILLHGDTLILSVLRDSGAKLMAVDATSGKTRWVGKESYGGSTTDYLRWRAMRGTVKPAKLDPVLNTATDGDVIGFIDGADIVCVGARTGKESWRTPFPQAEADRKAGGIKAGDNLWVGSLIVSGGVVVNASPSVLAGFSATNGKLLWEQPKKYIGHLWYEWKDVFVIEGLVWTWGEDLIREVLEGSGEQKRGSLFPQTVKGYDIRTGALAKSVPLGHIFKTHHHHRCYRNKATTRYILASRRGTEYVDLKEGKHTVDNWVRGTCHLGMMPANGLQYAPPHPCACYGQEKLNGMNALAPADAGGTRDGPGMPRLTQGPAFGSELGDEAAATDWPAFRHDGLRSGAVATAVPAIPQTAWRVRAGSRLSAPIVVHDRIIVSLIDEHHVACFGTADGSKLWEIPVNGRVDSPPTYWKGRLIFGSADGSVYCVRTGDGTLVWRFDAAPDQQLMGAFGQLESVWPIPGSVLVQDGVVYFCTGRTSQLDGGMKIFGLDALTGSIQHQRPLAGPRYTVDGIKENYHLPEGHLPDILVGEEDAISLGRSRFDRTLKPIPGRPKMSARGGFRDESYFKRMAWTMDGSYGRLMVRDKRSVYFIRMFDSLQGLNPNVYFTPGAAGYLLFAKDMGAKKQRWSLRIPARIRAMAQTEGKLFVAGPPDVVDPNDPLGAFEDRKGALLYVFDSDKGEKLTQCDLPSSPVLNGLAAAGGSLYLTDKAGYITRFVGK
ncbi:MAG: PQQ-binding-like beta-propeller repeat protein [Lentisphaerae bacterium]|jgi:outer membrane protein assembly factor BamB|nr:PQQ-binding-like beta-propeller repeat protein [Lentisphaerota bacterium]MBT4815908.1 PQQ-binding-like beta-propeller repeat protein [Lentisphaerota bacterium]MBT5611617.1 PQQ-binding-like beta-propeller repeat protein [Lentisphaerota bacterium]MBT7061716.1 PQQ-binding-like beta-propeller repeat protein [Lentisphaerota bacterium]MBT7846562.1 PQQ-binding-like beta-propeller repeat protein [Lentisphaerota bacterium]